MNITPEKVYCAYYGHKYSEIGKEWFLKAYPHFEERAKRAIRMAEAIQARHNVVLSVKQVAALCSCKTPNYIDMDGRAKILAKLGKGVVKSRYVFTQKVAVFSFEVEGWKSYEDADREHEEWRANAIKEINESIKKRMEFIFGK